MNNYALPFERPLSRGAFDFCDGPGGRWAAIVASAGIRTGLWHPGIILDDDFGAVNPLFVSGERPPKVSLCFDHYQKQVIAIQSSPANITVRFFTQSDILSTRIGADADVESVDSDVITAENESSGSLVSQIVTFSGLSPILFFNGISSIDPNNSNVICFYLKDGDPTTVYCRFLADNFGVEYLINGGLPVNLAALLKADLVRTGGTDHLAIWALTDDGRQVFIRSESYAPEIADRLTVDQTTGAGTYVNPPSIPTVEDDLTADFALHGSVYSATVLTASGPTDALTIDGTIASGLYISTVLPSAPIADRLTVASTIASGSYA